jgi:predicted metal-dependent hydrolase
VGHLQRRRWAHLECIEYLLVHEMLHLLEQRHNERFFAYLNLFFPNWKLVREELNRLPIGV